MLKKTNRGGDFITAEEAMFFDKAPGLLSVYLTLKEKLQNAYPDMTVKVSKTQISFRNRHIFAMASVPTRKLKGAPDEYLLVSFGLPRKSDSPRVAMSVEPYPGRWTCHAVAADAGGIDTELLRLIDEAYWFSMAK